jgi:putative endopeptidase
MILLFKRSFGAVAILASAASVSCATPEKAQVKSDAPAAVSKAAEVPRFVADLSKPVPPGLDEAAMDLRADPCSDFYRFACGGWMDATEIPSDKSAYSRGFISIADRNESHLKSILEEAGAGTLPKETAFAKHMGDYYATCMDEAKLEKSLPEVKAQIAKATAFKSSADLAKVIGQLHAEGNFVFFAVGSEQDLKNSSEVIGGLAQGGLSLPDRDYYLVQDDTKKKLREAFVAYVERMMTMSGQRPDVAKKSAAAVMEVETKLATASMSRVEMRDPQKLYNRVERKGLKELAKDINWDAYFAALGVKDLQAININSTKFFSELAPLLKDTKPEVLKAYLGWHVLGNSVPALPKTFQEAAFSFAANITGAKADRPRWKKCIAFVDSDLGEALGREFARRYFPEDTKKRTVSMIGALLQSFESNVKGLAWMDEPTRQAALRKAAKMVGNNKIGYPDVWRDYSAVKTGRDSFLKNSLAFNRFEMARQLAKIGKPVDRKEWGMSPPTVNAYYSPQQNEIVFPAGILQPPFFNKEATDAVNFGAMGMVVGHEITHGFDDEGRQFDAEGNLKEWWSEKVGKDFVSKAECVKKQYDGYVAVEDTKVKGDLTLGENIADQGGLKVSFAAMQDWYAKKPGVDANYRFTLPQQFFLGFAQSWCTKVRPEMARVRAVTDPHSPPYWRVNGTLGNSSAFSQAFQCSESAPMIRSGPERCAVW